MRLTHLLLAIPLLTHSLDDYLMRNTAYGFSGAVLVVRGNEIVLRKGYGLADRRAGIVATPRTPFNIASLDKQFIAAGILRLEELGKLKTTDPISRFFDFLPDDKKGITLHQLLSHTSGLENDYWDDHPELTRAAFVRQILADHPLAGTPGGGWRYSNSAFVVLERVIEIAAGEPYEDFMQRMLFAPAAMTETTFTPAANAAHYDFWKLDDHLPKGRAIWSTIDDLYRWRQALRNGKILTAASRTKMITAVKNDYAYGWNVVTTARGTRLVHHGGSESKGGMMATYRDFIDEDTLIVALSNSMQPLLSADYFAGDLEALVFGGEVHLPPPSTPAPATPRVTVVTDPEKMLAIAFPHKPAENKIANDAARAAAQRFIADLGPITGVETIGGRAFVLDGAAELQTYVRVTFEHGPRLIRVLQPASGDIETRPTPLPPAIELVLAPAGDGRCTTWMFQLATSATIPCGGR